MHGVTGNQSKLLAWYESLKTVCCHSLWNELRENQYFMQGQDKNTLSDAHYSVESKWHMALQELSFLVVYNVHQYKWWLWWFYSLKHYTTISLQPSPSSPWILYSMVYKENKIWLHLHLMQDAPFSVSLLWKEHMTKKAHWGVTGIVSVALCWIWDGNPSERSTDSLTPDIWERTPHFTCDRHSFCSQLLTSAVVNTENRRWLIFVE